MQLKIDTRSASGAILGFIVALALGLQPAAAASRLDDCKAQTATDWTVCGNAAFDEGRYDDAMAAYNQALRLDPRAWDTLFNRGTLAMGLGDNAAAIRDFDQALAIASDHCPEICFNRATAHYRMLRFPEAIADYSAVLTLLPENDQALFQRGICYSLVGNNDAALRDFAEVTRLKPGYVAAYSQRATLYTRMGNDDAALREDEKALAVEPTYADAYYDRAGIAWRRGNFQDAIRDYTTAIGFYAEAANGPSERVSRWYGQGAHAQPMRLGVSVRLIDLYLADAYYWRSRAWRSLGDTAKADIDLADALRVDPNVGARIGDEP
ncbi:tetratricopeptide repeat protein [Hypericibacter sp.]|uniref:tetratricopeptide repeat protein n=1 Tax=Hypericibacter sp. TaxID=2705401 RepID=UPI003D6D7472